MRSTAVKMLKVKPLPASAIQSLRLPPSTSVSRANIITAAAKAPKAASVDVAAELEKKVLARQELGDNVRFSNHVNKRDLYWKVSKPQRDVLKKLLKEA
ncbi:hypothetical protein PSEUBRA_001070 [Kalmanozyma brasiliensis GHG001]|uniref:Uncharacterized protein n=1 Tax=Kalmanozyma brasiliensis (strain GHG001) TaxID=1365824 RepID=V5F1F7_KALBG|nr:uncharacterized protein PSEUBRA_001070 [Kalmanozyma brasiliensis GHG001]EST09124.1 hypothetical protein PSEUBRA_001070 [Kalmanozyma brasiliensis GHG001]